MSGLYKYLDSKLNCQAIKQQTVAGIRTRLLDKSSPWQTSESKIRNKTILDTILAWVNSAGPNLISDPGWLSKLLDHLRQIPEVNPGLVSWLDSLATPGLSDLGSGIQQSLLHLIKTTRELHAFNTGSADLANRIYYNIKCWIYSVFTLVLDKGIYRSHSILSPPLVGENLVKRQCLDTGLETQCLRYKLPSLAINPDYLFFISGSYYLVDTLIDSRPDESSSISIIGLLGEIKTLLDMPADQSSSIPVTTPAQFLYSKLVSGGYSHAKINMAKYCLQTEIDCFKLQRNPDLTRQQLIQLTLDKGISTGRLVIAGLVDEESTPSNSGDLFDQYCVLMQVIDDLADFGEDILAGGIKTSAHLLLNPIKNVPSTVSYAGYALCVLDMILDWLIKCQEAGHFDNNQLHILKSGYCNYWCYAVSKNASEFIKPDISQLDREVLELVRDLYWFDADYIKDLRERKNKNKAGLTRIKDF